MERMGMVIGIAPDRIEEYKALHVAVWPQILAALQAANVRNYTIFLREPENLLFGYWEYNGQDYDADMRLVAAQPDMHKWWALCSPCQVPLASRKDDEHWAMMAPVFHMD